MPANTKYLTQSLWQRLAKIVAGFVGGFIISALLHMCFALWLPNNKKEILITSIYTVTIVWGVLLIIPYLFKNGWKVLALYLILSIILYTLYYFTNQQNILTQ